MRRISWVFPLVLALGFAAAASIRPIDRSTARTVEDVRARIAGLPAGTWTVLHVERGGRMIHVPFEIP